jgi:hypothetical protein
MNRVDSGLRDTSLIVENDINADPQPATNRILGKPRPALCVSG